MPDESGHTTRRDLSQALSDNNVSLKEYLEARLNSLERDFQTKLNASETARTIASTEMDRRLEGMNEFRDTLRDQASRFVTGTEVNLMMKPIAEDIRVLREYKAEVAGKASQTSAIVALLIALLAILIGGIGLALTVFSLIRG